MIGQAHAALCAHLATGELFRPEVPPSPGPERTPSPAPPLRAPLARVELVRGSHWIGRAA